MAGKPTISRKGGSNPLSGKLAESRKAAEAEAEKAGVPEEAVESDPRPEGYESPQPAGSGPENPWPDGSYGVLVPEPEDSSPEGEGPTEPTNVFEKIKAMEADQAALRAELKARDARLAEDDDEFFIARARGKSWAERKVVDKAYVDVQFHMTKFMGPFETRAAAEGYLSVKRGRNAGDWENVEIVTGEERRAIRRREMNEAEKAGAREIPV